MHAYVTRHIPTHTYRPTNRNLINGYQVYPVIIIDNRLWAII